MDMNKAFFAKKGTRKPLWRVVDAQGKVLGRLATQIANILRGKDKPEFTNHTDFGDYVVVVNAEKVKMTGNKMEGKVYGHYTGWIGGLKEASAKEVMEKDPTKILKLAVKRMLPKNRLSATIFKKLKVYAGENHPHAAQVK